MAALTGLLLGGVVPATVALLLARQARRQAYASGGFLTGAVWVRRGERLAWAGLALAALALVVVLVAGLLQATGGVRGARLRAGIRLNATGRACGARLGAGIRLNATAAAPGCGPAVV